MSEKGGWVFISHSHLDIDIVRYIRNQLEKMGFNPLTFYLKCLTDEDEIEDLIKREISVREWFIFVNSENARRSHWVETERDYIEEIGGKNVCVIDAHSSPMEIDLVLCQLTDRMRINVVYLEQDVSYAEMTEQILLEHDFSVKRTPLPGPLSSATELNTLIDAQNGGFLLFLFSNRSLCSEECLKRLDSMLLEKQHVLFVSTEDCDGDAFCEIMGGFGSVLPEMTAAERDAVYKNIRSLINLQTNPYAGYEGFHSATKIIYPAIDTIEDYTFSDCDVLREVEIPDSVIYISSKAFEGKENVLIRCSPGSHAERFCKKHRMNYLYISG